MYNWITHTNKRILLFEGKKMRSACSTYFIFVKIKWVNIQVKFIEQCQASKKCYVGISLYCHWHSHAIRLPAQSFQSPQLSDLLSSDLEEGRGMGRKHLLTFFSEFKAFLTTLGYRIYQFPSRTCQLGLWF